MILRWSDVVDSGQGRVVDRLFRQARNSVRRCVRLLAEDRPGLASRALRQAVDFYAAADRLGWESLPLRAEIYAAAARAGVTIEGP